MRITRRNLFRLGGAAAGALTASACSPPHSYRVEKPAVPGSDQWRRFEERTIRTTCSQCSAGCGLQARVVEGRVVRLDGNASHPVNLGGLAACGQAGLQAMYDPDRIVGPLFRERKGGPFRPIEWDDAISILADRIAALQDGGLRERLLILCGRERGILRDLWQRFARALGTPNFFDDAERKGGAIRAASLRMRGHGDLLGPNLGEIKTILNVGSGLLESPMEAQAIGRIATRSPDDPPPVFIHVAASYTQTSMYADRFVPIAPGSEHALLLAIAHVLIRDGLYDSARVAQDRGWSDDGDQPGFATVVAKRYSPAAVSEFAGIDAAEIESLARRLWQNRPAVSLLSSRSPWGPNGMTVAVASMALNRLLGSESVASTPNLPISSWADFDDAHRGGADAERLPESDLANALAARAPYPIDTALLYYTNPLYSRPQPRAWKAALAAIPFVATFSPYMDETSNEVADLILPDHTYLESWGATVSQPTSGGAAFGVQQPVVEPLHDTRATGDVLLALAAELGDPLESALPWKSMQHVLASRATGLHKAQRGSIVTQSAKKFFRALFDQGFWQDDDTPDEPFVAANDFDFAPESLDAQAGDESTEALPLLLEAYTPSNAIDGGGAHMPLLEEAVADLGRSAWRTEAILSPHLASAYSIAEGDRIRVTSAVGSIDVHAKLVEGTHPRIVRIARGGGHSAFGRFAAGWGANVMDLIPIRYDPTGFPLTGAQPIRIEKLA